MWSCICEFFCCFDILSFFLLKLINEEEYSRWLVVTDVNVFRTKSNNELKKLLVHGSLAGPMVKPLSNR